MKRLAAATLVLASACGPKTETPHEDRRQVIEGLTLSQSFSGHPDWNLYSTHAVLHEDSNVADLESPVMDFYREGKKVSRMTSRTGVVQTVTHDVQLSSSVVVDSYEDNSRLDTEVLNYSSKTGRFHTDDEVVIHRPEGVIYGKGMDGTPDLSEVHIYRQHSVLSGKTSPAHP